MSDQAGFVAMAGRLAERLALKTLSRDNAQLGPATLTQAAARRMRQGLRALEAYVRRLILCLALQIEPELTAGTRMARPHSTTDRQPVFVEQDQPASLRVFEAGRAFDPSAFSDRERLYTWRTAPVVAAPLLTRLQALKMLALDPVSRARRLAWHMARYRPGPMLAPDVFRALVPRRYGTELSMLYEAMGHGIVTASHERPPPLGPVPRSPPRIRTL